MKKIFFGLITLLLLNSLLAFPVKASTIPVQITVNPGNAGGIIPSNFLGLSTVVKYIVNPTSFDYDPKGSNDQILIKLLKNLGKGVLRFGGTDINYTYWLKTPTSGLCKSSQSFPDTVLSKANVDNLFAFAKEIDWSVIFGLNLGCYNSTMTKMAVDEATYFQKSGGNSLLALEIGNEPDTFIGLGLRETGYYAAKSIVEFLNYDDAIHKVSLKIPTTGPATVSSPGWLTKFLAATTLDMSKTNSIVFSTAHLYTLAKSTLGIDINARICEKSKCLEIIDKLLSKDQAEAVNTKIHNYATIAKQANATLRYDEVGAITHGGVGGVTDTFASTLWGVDTLFMAASNGITGVNFASGGCGGYTPILFCPTVINSSESFRPRYEAGATYYSMLFFHEATKDNSRIVQVEYDKSLANLGVYAVLSQDNALRVILINRDSKNSIAASLNPGDIPAGVFSQARIVRLLAPSIDATREKITFAGNSVKGDGSWVFGKDEPVTKINNKYQVTLSPGSAAIVTFSTDLISNIHEY